MCSILITVVGILIITVRYLAVLAESVPVPVPVPESPGRARVCDDPHYIKRRFNAMFPDAMIGHAVGPFQIGNAISYLYGATPTSAAKNATQLKASICPLKRCEHHQLYSEIYSLYGGIHLAAEKLKDIARQVNISYDAATCAHYCGRLHASFRRHNDMLVVVTTSNQFEMTAKLLQSLNTVKEPFDLVFVDDSSVDGTPEYLVKKVDRIFYIDVLSYCLCMCI